MCFFFLLLVLLVYLPGMIDQVVASRGQVFIGELIPSILLITK